MRIATIFYILIVLYHSTFGQTVAETIHHRSETKSISKYVIPSVSNYLLIASEFSKEDVETIPFSDKRIISIDLVNTAFSEDPEFDQYTLDLQRLTRLISLNDQVVNNQFIQWRIIRQTGCSSQQSCADFFHGFVIRYEAYFTKEDNSKEIDSVRQILANFYEQLNQRASDLIFDYTEIRCEYPEFSYSKQHILHRIEQFYQCSQSYKAKVFFTVQVNYLGRPEKVVVNGYNYDCEEELANILVKSLRWERGLIIGNEQYPLNVKGSLQFPLKNGKIAFHKYYFPDELTVKNKIVQNYPICLAYETDTIFTDVLERVDQGVVMKSLIRNKLEPKTIIVDVTASMYPYSADLLKWVKTNTASSVCRYVFFNDGDDKPTKQKQIGSTGGIYKIDSESFVDIRDTIYKAMRAGGGGDNQENNIEALLASGRSSATDTVVMIADNLSFPRDVDLLREFKGHLHIILCGTSLGINTLYLDMARAKNISLHVESEDITDLHNIRINEIFDISGLEYQLTNRGFKRVY